MTRTTDTATSPSTAAPSPAATGQRPAVETIAEMLAAQPGHTAAELAALTGLGGSTVTKALATLEKDGLARRNTPEATTAGRRPAAHWHPSPDGAPSTADASSVPTPDPAPAAPTQRRVNRRPSSATTASGDGRLGKGRLSELVLEYLIAHPETDLGPTAIAKALNRSQGAIANALAKFTADGDVVQTGDKPRRYRFAG